MFVQRHCQQGFFYLCLCFILFVHLPLNAATCSCAGVPLLNSMDASSADAGLFYLNVTYEDHEISDLVSGSSDVSDETNRERRAQSLLLEMSYGISEKWAVSGMLSAIEHDREIGISKLGNESASGLGDAILLFKYTPLRISPILRHEIAVGFGARIPLGVDDAGGTIPLSEDMQPSTGSWAGVLWANYTRSFHASARLQSISNLNYTVNTENDRNYSFGDELNLATGFSYQPESKFAYSALFRYRQTKVDKRDGASIPNTGGEWLDLVPAMQYSFSDKIAAKLSGRIPLYRKLKGPLQFTTSYSYAVTLSYVF